MERAKDAVNRRARMLTPTPRFPLAISKVEAAQRLGVSVDFLEAHVLPELKAVRRGRKVLIPVPELESWLEKNAAKTLPAP